MEGLVVSRTSGTIAVILQCRAAAGHCLAERFANRASKRVELWIGERACRCERMDPRCEKCFVGIDIADAGKNALIEQYSFDHTSRLMNASFQLPAGDRQRIRSENRPSFGEELFIRRKRPQAAEAARITEEEFSLAGGGLENPPTVNVGCRMFVGRCVISASRTVYPALTRHAKVDADRRTAFADDRELLAVTLKPADALVEKQRMLQRFTPSTIAGTSHDVRPMHAHVRYDRPDQRGFKRVLEVFDFRQFRHIANDIPRGR